MWQVSNDTKAAKFIFLHHFFRFINDLDPFLSYHLLEVFSLSLEFSIFVTDLIQMHFELKYYDIIGKRLLTAECVLKYVVHSLKQFAYTLMIERLTKLCTLK